VSESNTWKDDEAIRGGVPVVFPQFGKQLDPNMAQHGFLRSNRWLLSLGHEVNDVERGYFSQRLAMSDVDVLRNVAGM